MTDVWPRLENKLSGTDNSLLSQLLPLPYINFRQSRKNVSSIGLNYSTQWASFDLFVLCSPYASCLIFLCYVWQISVLINSLPGINEVNKLRWKAIHVAVQVRWITLHYLCKLVKYTVPLAIREAACRHLNLVTQTCRTVNNTDLSCICFNLIELLPVVFFQTSSPLFPQFNNKLFCLTHNSAISRPCVQNIFQDKFSGWNSQQIHVETYQLTWSLIDNSSYTWKLNNWLVKFDQLQHILRFFSQ